MSGMCDLLANNFNFNLRTNMLITLIPYGTSPVMKGALAEKVVATVNEVSTGVGSRFSGIADSSIDQRTLKAKIPDFEGKNNQIDPDPLTVKRVATITKVRLRPLGKSAGL